MADFALGRAFALSRERNAVIEWLIAHREVVALASIMAVAAALRLWGLEAKALHHDESLHAQYTWYLYDHGAYRHDPLMHGPFKFHAGAAVFFLFGDTEFTSRLLPALFGTALVGMPYLLRRQIGMTAVLAAALLLAVSPTVLYVSRFFRDDIYIEVWVFAIVICIWRYLDDQRPVYLYAMAAVLSLSFATMEITFIHAAIFMLFLDLAFAFELGRRRPREGAGHLLVALRIAMLAPVAWLIAAAWPLLGRRPFGREQVGPVGDVMLLMGTLVLPQFAAGVQQLPFVGDKGYQSPDEESLRNITVLVLLVLSAYAGLLWKPRVWLIAAAAFYVPYVLLYTTFLSNVEGFWSGIWGSLDYWLDQHDVRRGNQPYYYYAMLTPIYEFLPLLVTAAGAVWLSMRGGSLGRWLLFWVVGIFIGLSIAGEKMPWLEVHIAVPLCLAAGVILGKAIDALRAGASWVTLAVLAGLTALVTLAAVDGEGFLRTAGLVALALLATACLGAGLSAGRLALMRGAGVVTLTLLLTLTTRAAIMASFQNDDTPVELLVYTQTSDEIPALRDRIDRLARESGLGHELPIVVDTTDGFAWPWAWYLRDYNNVTYTVPTRDNQPPQGAVLLVALTNASQVDQTGYSQTPYKHRWWFCESYREPTGSCTTDGAMTPGQIVARLSDPDVLASTFSFFLYRRDESRTGSVNAVAFFPDSLTAFEGATSAPAEPQVLPDGRISFGSLGRGPGYLARPAGVSVDNQGAIWIADSSNGRIQQFDAAGNFLRQLGGSGQFNEPWYAVVGPDGNLYVADTWAHRIQVFSPDLQLISTWGQPVTQVPDPDPLRLFGPRSIVFADDGSLWVADTGNKRITRFSREGRPLATVGGAGDAPGQFQEPVGLARDAQGRYYVADTWNARIQRFEPDFTSPQVIPATWASQDIFGKPYLAVLNDGRILASDPTAGALLLYDAQGNPAGSWSPALGGMPLGVAALPHGGFVYTDIQRNIAEVVPAGLIDQLFK